MNEERINYQYIWAPTNDKIQFQKSKTISPYLELNNYIINNKKNKKIYEVNPYIRFNKIFSMLDEIYFYFPNIKEKKYIFEIFESKLLNYYRNLDFLEGITKIEILSEKIIKEIENNLFGYKIAKKFKKLKYKNKKIISLLLINNIIMKREKLNIFMLGIKLFFPGNIFYCEKNNCNKWYLFINDEKTEENKKIVEILKIMFLYFEIKIKIFWKYHFGIVNLLEINKIEKVSFI